MKNGGISFSIQLKNQKFPFSFFFQKITKSLKINSNFLNFLISYQNFQNHPLRLFTHTMPMRNHQRSRLQLFQPRLHLLQLQSSLPRRLPLLQNPPRLISPPCTMLRPSSSPMSQPLLHRLQLQHTTHRNTMLRQSLLSWKSRMRVVELEIACRLILRRSTICRQ